MKLKLLNWLVLVAVATALTDPVLARPDTASNSASTAADEIVPIVELDSASLRDAIVVLAKEAHLDVQFDPKLLQTNGPDGHSIPIIPPVVNAKWTNVTARQALQALLDNWGWQMTQVPGNPIFRVEARDPGEVRSRGTKFKLLGCVSTNGITGDEVAPAIVLDGASLLDAIGVLAAQSKLNIQFEPRLLYRTGPDGHTNPISPQIVNEKWSNVTARQALQALLDKHGLEMMSTPGSPILRVVSMNP